jgi:hypothetical protein
MARASSTASNAALFASDGFFAMGTPHALWAFQYPLARDHQAFGGRTCPYFNGQTIPLTIQIEATCSALLAICSS